MSRLSMLLIAFLWVVASRARHYFRKNTFYLYCSRYCLYFKKHFRFYWVSISMVAEAGTTLLSPF